MQFINNDKDFNQLNKKLILQFKCFALFMSLFATACNQNENKKLRIFSKNEIQKTIVIQPYLKFSKIAINNLAQQLKTFNKNIIIRKNIDFPDSAYYQPRNRYRADIIIKDLKQHIGNDSIIVGITDKDISVTKDGIYDWGVMGLGYRPGKSCVVSTFRLNKKNIEQQFYKVVLHELGHTEGLPHCPVSSCLMRDAEGKNPLDDEKDFCKDCKQFLINKHWNL